MSDNSVIEPKHYTQYATQPIDVIEEWCLGFNLGNAIKYIARAGKKPGVSALEDLRKARWYLDRHIQKVTDAQQQAIQETSQSDVVGERSQPPEHLQTTTIKGQAGPGYRTYAPAGVGEEAD